VLACAVAIVLAYGALQYWWLPPEGFLTGDQGAKYLQARAVLQHGPFHPWVEGPGLDLDVEHRWQEPFLIHNGDHLVSLFPWLLSVFTAPFLWLFGLRGLYVVPALSVAITFGAACRIGRRLGQPGRGIWSGWCAVLATPMLVYGAELWEHAPAVALTTVAAALMMPRSSRRTIRYISAGVCLGFAASLRTETVLMIPALGIAAVWVRRSVGPQAGLVRELAGVALGVVAAAAVVALGNEAVYGTLIPYQVSSNLGLGLPYLGVRSDALLTLVFPTFHHKLFVLGLAALAAGVLAPSLSARLRSTHAAILLLLLVGVGAPLFHTYVQHRPWLSTFGAQNIAQTCPFIFVLTYWLALRRENPGERFLFAAVWLFLLFVFITMPHTGGAQWSARFFLAAMPLAAALAVQVFVSAEAAGRQSRSIRAIAAAAVIASVGVQVYGLTYLATFKRVNASITRATALRTQPGEIIVSDLYWFPQVTATLYPTRRLLFAPSSDAVGVIAARALSTGATRFWVAASTPMTRFVPPPEFVWEGHTARLVHEHDLLASSLTLYEYSSTDR
jgi:hypothetical protein